MRARVIPRVDGIDGPLIGAGGPGRVSRGDRTLAHQHMVGRGVGHARDAPPGAGVATAGAHRVDEGGHHADDFRQADRVVARKIHRRRIGRELIGRGAQDGAGGGVVHHDMDGAVGQHIAQGQRRIQTSCRPR